MPSSLIFMSAAIGTKGVGELQVKPSMWMKGLLTTQMFGHISDLPTTLHASRGGLYNWIPKASSP